MSNFLKPNLNVLPPPQKQVWEELSSTPSDFILYGGTAIALRLGHRTSVDFDFFSPKNFDPEQLYRDIPYLDGGKILQQTKNTLTCRINREGEVFLSFFGGLTIKQVSMPSVSQSNNIRIASLLDLAGTKAAVIQKRSELKDYLDIDALLTEGKLSLDVILACGQVIYGNAFNPIITLKALVYFEDSELKNLAPQIKKRLKTAVQNVHLEQIPQLDIFNLGAE
jgi:nucleotidyltransferase AbiEii toxin of type IV toxin-antitoxin system